MLRVAVAAAAAIGFGASDAAAATPDYEPLRSYGTPGGEGAGGIAAPEGIGVDPISGRIVVADAGAQRVAVFRAGGRFLRAFGKDVDPAGGDGPEVCSDRCRIGTDGTEGGAFGSPWDAEVSPDGRRIYVVERANERVSVFTARGRFQRTFGYDVTDDEGPAPEICTEHCFAGLPTDSAGGFNGPSSASFGPGGDLYITDSRNNRIAHYTPRGRFTEALGKDVSSAGGSGWEACADDATCRSGAVGGAAGALNDLRGIGFSPSGDAFAGSWSHHRVSALSLSPPRFRFAFGKDVVPDSPESFEICTDLCWSGWADDTPGAIDGAHGIAIDARGTVYVADANNNRINVYRRNGAFEHSFGYGVVPGDPGDEIDVCTAITGCRAGSPRGALEQPHGLYVDCRGTLFAASQASGELTAFATGPRAHPGPCRLRPKRARLNRRRGTAKLRVLVPYASRLTLNGRGIERSRTGHRGLEGNEQLKIKPRGRLKRKLRRRGHARARVTVTMRPTDGNAVQRRSKRITLRKRR